MQRRVMPVVFVESSRAPAREEGIEMIQNTASRVAELLHQAGETHHIVFADTDGNDDDWATFYSDWLLAHSDLPKLLGRPPRAQSSYE